MPTKKCLLLVACHTVAVAVEVVGTDVEVVVEVVVEVEDEVVVEVVGDVVVKV